MKKRFLPVVLYSLILIFLIKPIGQALADVTVRVLLCRITWIVIFLILAIAVVWRIIAMIRRDWYKKRRKRFFDRQDKNMRQLGV